MEPIILNSKGQPIVLTDQEKMISNAIQSQIKNALGYDIPITTLTTIMKKISEQKFFQVAPADYLPVVVGEGAWSQQLTTYRSYQIADSFATGVLNTGNGNARLARADSGVDAVNLAVKNWAKSIDWTIMDLEQAARAGNWDLVTSKEEGRKTNWDLGIQEVAFLGLKGDSSVLGLLNQAVTPNTSLINDELSQMDGAELKAFCATVLGAYRSNCNRTAWPTHFIIPEDDYLGLASFTSADFPLRSVLEVLLSTFQTMTNNKNFKILPLAYAMATYNSDAGLNKTRYTLLNYDEKSIRMNIPVNYQNTLANSANNFSYENVGYGQFTGVTLLRPLELFYMDLD